jgi:hypothetical protein
MRITSPDWWNPIKVFIALFVGALVLDSIFAVWGEGRPVGGFFEEFIARIGNYLTIFGSLGGAIYIGLQAYKKTENTLIGWVAGILGCFLIGFVLTFVFSNIPGVDWRFDRIMNTGEGGY